MTLAKTLPRLKLSPPPGLPRLIYLTDSARSADPVSIAATLPAGSAVIFRHYGTPDRAAIARRLARLCRRRHVALLIADDARLAARVGADGLHVPEFRIHAGPRRWRLLRRKGWLVTAAAHSRAAIVAAARQGCCAVLVSPVFQTASHPDAQPLGVARFALLAAANGPAVYALGGLSQTTARRLKGTGAAGIAGISGFQSK